MSREAEIKARLEAATRGPWQAVKKPLEKTEAGRAYLGDKPDSECETLIFTERPGAYGEPTPIVAAAFGPFYEPGRAVYITDANAELIAHAPEDLAHLLAEVERLKAALEVAEFERDYWHREAPIPPRAGLGTLDDGPIRWSKEPQRHPDHPENRRGKP